MTFFTSYSLVYIATLPVVCVPVAGVAVDFGVTSGESVVSLLWLLLIVTVDELTVPRCY